MVNSNQPPTKRAKSDKSSQGNSRSQDPQRSSSKPIQKHSNDTNPDEASDNSSEEIMGKGSDVVLLGFILLPKSNFSCVLISRI